jgi:tetratricopeptide (TPR) repeat protein
VPPAVGLVALYKDDRRAAEHAFQAALTLDPDDREALGGLVTVDVSQHNFREAEARIDKELARRGDDAQLLLMLGRTRNVAGDTAGAEEALKKAILIAPSTLEAYSLLGDLYYREKRLDQAVAEFDRLATRDPKSVMAHTAVAMLLQLQNKPDEARKRYEKVLELNPRAPVAANNLAWMYSESGQSLDVALQMAQTAKAELPDQPDVSDTLGWIYCKKGLYSLGIPALVQSVEKQPKNPEYLFHLGFAYVKSGEQEKGRSMLERALATGTSFTGSDEAKRMLASLKG